MLKCLSVAGLSVYQLLKRNIVEKFKNCVTIFLVFILSLVISCATNPVTGRPEFVLMSESQEIAMGQQMDPKIIKEYGYYPDEAFQEYVNQVGQQLAAVCDRPDLHYRFKVLDSTIINAFALPGGYVYVTRGLLAYLNSEAELAGVLGHEIGHITARHSVKKYTKAQSYQLGILAASIFYPEISQLGQFADFLALAIIQGYGRSYELQSDRLGIKYSSSVKYDPYCVSSFMKTLNNIEEATGKKGYHGLFSSHPETEERIVKSGEEAKKVTPLSDEPFKQFREEYLSKIDGIFFGEGPEEGVVVRNTFRHPDLKIEFTFPEGWTINNGKEVLAATHPENKYYIQMRLSILGKKLTAADFAKKVKKSYRFSELSGTDQSINGLSSYVGTYEGTKNEIGIIKAQMASILLEDKGYTIMGFSSPESFDDAMPFFTSTINSFRKLSAEEAEKISLHKIRIYTVKEGDTWESIARECGQQPGEAKTLALINAFDPLTFPPPGTKIKVPCAEGS
jgi:predicted Zn-dependent protease